MIDFAEVIIMILLIWALIFVLLELLVLHRMKKRIEALLKKGMDKTK